MLIDFFSKSMAVILMAVVSVVGLIIRAAVSGRCNRLIRQSKDLVLAGDKSLKQLRVRFESAYRLNKGSVSAKSMADSFLGSCTLLGFPLKSLEHIHGGLFIFCLIVGTGGFGYLFNHGFSVRESSAVFFTGLVIALFDLFIGMLFGIHNTSDVSVSLTDYLENSLSARLAMENEQKEKNPQRQGMRDDLFMKKEETETGLELYKDQPVTVSDAVYREPDKSPAERCHRMSERDEQIIADVLKEYLGRKSLTK